MADLLLLSGDDAEAVAARRDAWLAERADVAAPERLELDEVGVGQLVTSLRSAGLFSAQRVLDVTGADVIDADAARAIARACVGSDCSVLLRAGARRPHRAVTDALSDVGRCVHLKLPGAKQLPGRVQQMARDAGVTIDRRAAAEVAARAGHDLPRVGGVLRMLARAGIARPQTRQVLLLLGSAAVPAVPWAVTDAVERGDVVAALDELADADPQAVLALLARRLVDIARVCEDGITSADAAAVLGGPAWRARHVVSAARRTDARAVGEVLSAVVDATTASRGGADDVEALVAATVTRAAGAFA